MQITLIFDEIASKTSSREKAQLTNAFQFSLWTAVPAQRLQLLHCQLIWVQTIQHRWVSGEEFWWDAKVTWQHIPVQPDADLEGQLSLMVHPSVGHTNTRPITISIAGSHIGCITPI